MQKRLNRPMLKLKTIPTTEDQTLTKQPERANISRIIPGLFIGGMLSRLRSGETGGPAELDRHQCDHQSGLSEISHSPLGQVRVLRLRPQRQTNVRNSQLHRANHFHHQRETVRGQGSARPLLRSKINRAFPARRPLSLPSSCCTEECRLKRRSISCGTKARRSTRMSVF